MELFGNWYYKISFTIRKCFANYHQNLRYSNDQPQQNNLFYRSNFFVKLNFSIAYVGRMPKVCQIPFKLSILIDFTLSDWHMYFSISFPRLYYTLHAYYACITWYTLVSLKIFLHNMYYVPFI